MIDTVFATKFDIAQAWTKAGIRVPVTKVKYTPMTITQIKDTNKDGYQAIQVGFGAKKWVKVTRQLQGHLKKTIKDASAKSPAPRFLREIRVDSVESLKAGQHVLAPEVLQPGDIVNVSGISKGRGFSGVVKRWGFHGGPRTHGQSDRERAPGSIGQGTTPGRIYKGKKMAGHFGNTQMTSRNLTVLALDPDNQEIWLSGQIPGSKNGVVIIHKIGHKTPLDLLNAPGTPTQEPTPETPPAPEAAEN